MIEAELNEKRDRIIVRFSFSRSVLDRVKSIPGRKYVDPEHGGPYWTIPADMISARALRSKFDGEVRWGPNVLAWGREQRDREEHITELAHATDHPLDQLKIATKLPKLAEWMRGYQRADTAFLGQVSALNANEQGLGKTAELIAAVFEADLEEGPQLVMAPVTSIEVVWQYELERWQPFPVLAAEDPREREKNIKEAARLYAAGEPFWLVVNAGMVRYNAIKGWDEYKEKIVEVGVEPKYEEFFTIKWNTASIDEFHKVGLNNQKTLAARALYALDTKRRYGASGTPFGGVPKKLFGPLKFIAPKEHTSYWRWAETWLEVTEVDIGRGRKAKEVGGIQKGKEEAFYRHHSKYMVRHLKSEVLPQLPPKQYVDVWCTMSAKQKKQYETFAKEAEVRIDEYNLTATGILAEYARLKVLASAYCEVEGKMRRCKNCKGTGFARDVPCEACGGEGVSEALKLKPTFDCAQLPYLMERLSGAGIDPEDPSGEACAVVGSESLEIIDMVHRYLNEQGIKAEKITGNTVKPGERKRLVQAFQAGGADAPRVMCLSTLAGGVAITLDRADTVHVLTETWVPDDQEQLIDRIHRASRIHQVTAYFYRTKSTLHEYIWEVNQDKAFVNKDILDLRRQGFRAIREKGAK